jgi:hypothetical protein
LYYGLIGRDDALAGYIRAFNLTGRWRQIDLQIRSSEAFSIAIAAFSVGIRAAGSLGRLPAQNKFLNLYLLAIAVNKIINWK